MVTNLNIKTDQDVFIAVPLDPKSKQDLIAIQNFTINNIHGQGLSEYLKKCACQDQIDNLMRTYLVKLKSNNECVGYFSLKAGLISYNEKIKLLIDKEKWKIKFVTSFDTIPGIELADFAVNSSFTDKYDNYKGLGYVIFSKFVVPIAQQVADIIGVKIIYIYAIDQEKLIKNYERYGFSRLDKTSERKLHNRVKPSYDKGCIFMFQVLN